MKPPPDVESWFASRGWEVFPFQRESWTAYLAGESGLIHSTTGTGKTYAAFLGPVIEALGEPTVAKPPLRVLWVTPMRALAKDTAKALEAPLEALGLGWDVGLRTGDTHYRPPFADGKAFSTRGFSMRLAARLRQAFEGIAGVFGRPSGRASAEPFPGPGTSLRN